MRALLLCALLGCSSPAPSHEVDASGTATNDAGPAEGDASAPDDHPLDEWVLRHEGTGVRAWETAIVVDPETGRVIQHGGHDFGDYVQTGYTRLLDPMTGHWRWSSAHERPQRRCITEMVWADSIGRAVTFFGRTSHGSLPQGGPSGDHTQIWRRDETGPWLYDPRADDWRTALDGTVDELLDRHTAVAYEASSDAIYAIQGERLMVYAVHANALRWLPLPEALHGRKGYGIAAHPTEGKVVVFGGTGPHNYNWSWDWPDRADAYDAFARRDTWVFDVRTREWRELDGAGPDAGFPMFNHLTIPLVFHPPSGSFVSVQTPQSTYEVDATKWPVTDVWQLRLDTGWQHVPMRNALRFPPLMTYDRRRDRFIAVGGMDDARRSEAQRLSGTDAEVHVTASDTLHTARLSLEGPGIAAEPIVLRRSFVADGVRLEWDAPLDRELRVLRAEVVDGWALEWREVDRVGAHQNGIVVESGEGAFAYRLRGGEVWSTTVFSAPDVPTDGTLRVVDEHTVALSWASDAPSWEVQRRRGSGGWESVARVDAPELVDTVDLSDGVFRHYRVRAIAADGERGGFGLAMHTAPPGPRGFAVDALGEGRFRVRWQPRAGETELGLRVYFRATHANTHGWSGESVQEFWRSWTDATGERLLMGGEGVLTLPEGPGAYFYARYVGPLGQPGYYTDIVSPFDERFDAHVD